MRNICLIIIGFCVFFFVVNYLVCGCGMWKGYTGDNPAEEMAEELIKAKTGLDLDLSPSSQEN